MSAATEVAESARENLAGVTATLEDLAADFGTLARTADKHGLNQPGIMLRHFEREIHLMIQQGNAVIGAVLAAEKEAGS